MGGVGSVAAEGLPLGGTLTAERRGPGLGARGLRAPSTAGCRRAGASFSCTRSRSAPLASSVTMDISLFCRPLLALGETAGAVAAWQLRRRTGDQLGSGSSGGSSRHRRRHCRRRLWGEEEEEGEKAGPAVPQRPPRVSSHCPSCLVFTTPEKPPQSSTCVDRQPHPIRLVVLYFQRVDGTPLGFDGHD